MKEPANRIRIKRVPGTRGIRLQAHYLNASPNAIDAQVKVIFHLAKPGTVTQRAGFFFFLNPQILVPPAPPVSSPPPLPPVEGRRSGLEEQASP